VSDVLLVKKTNPFPAEYADLLLTRNWKLPTRALYTLKLIAQWRLSLARKEDLAISFVIK